MKLGFAAFLLLSISASAQVVAPYTENFDSGLPAGWTISNSSSEGVGWAVDGDPGIPVVGNGSGGAGTDGPTAGGSAGSLNYNDGFDFEEDIALGANKGTATSPVIDVSGLGGAAYVSFDLNMETDFYLSQDPTLDYFFVTVYTDMGDIVTIDFGDNTTPLGLTYFFHSGPMGTFRRVGFDFSLFGFTPGFTTIQIDFNFTTGDDTNNAYNGIFVDNLQVCSDTIPPAAPVNLLPVDGSTVIGGVGIPTSLDWSDAVDSSDCGTGAVWFYLLTVYNAGNVVVYSSAPDGTQDTIVAGLPAGTYHWEVQALDGALLLGALSVNTFFTIETALPPAAADTLFVNERVDGAQSGDPGFVDPVIDQQPAFSAIYRDPNTVDSASGLRFQVTDDPTFATLLFDSGLVGISPVLPKDSRSPDLTINVSLQRDTVHYWRIQFTDVSGFTGPFSTAQSFRIGDDFEFGVRHGSSHHGRRCYVATAAFGADSVPAADLRRYRGSVLERAGAGAVFSRGYASAGATLSRVLPGRALSLVVAPLAALSTAAGAGSSLLLAVLLCVLGFHRLARPAVGR